MQISCTEHPPLHQGHCVKHENTSRRPFLQFTEIILRSVDGLNATNLAHDYSNSNGRREQIMHRAALQAKGPISRKLVETSGLQLRSVYFTTATPKTPATLEMQPSSRCGPHSSITAKIGFSTLNGLIKKIREHSGTQHGT